MNLDCRFVVVWPRRQTSVRVLLQHQNRSLLQADVRRFPVSAVVGVAVPAAVCRWGLAPVLSCPDVGRCLLLLAWG